MRHCILTMLCVLLGAALHSQSKLNKESLAWLNRMDSCLALRDGEKVADIGSGDLYNLTLLASRHPQVQFYAVDVQRSYKFSKRRRIKNICKKYALPDHHNIHTSRATYTSSLLQSNSFDRVLLINAFHELSDPAGVMADVKRILKPGACLVIEEPLNEVQSSYKHAGCRRAFYTEAEFKERLNSFGIGILEEAVVYKPLPEERYFIRKQFRCRFL